MKEGGTLSTFLSFYNQCSIIYYTKYLISVRAHHFQIGVSTNSKPTVFLIDLTSSVWHIQQNKRSDEPTNHPVIHITIMKGTVENLMAGSRWQHIHLETPAGLSTPNKIMQNVFVAGNFNVHFKNENNSANLPSQNNAECFQCTCFAVLIKTTGREPLFPDEHAYSFLHVSYNNW